MPVVKDREYRTLTAPLAVRAKTDEAEAEKDYIVEGYATTFDAPYELFEYAGTKYYEQIDRHALDDADMSDVIMQYDHSGRVFARQSNGTLTLSTDDHGLKVEADLGSTETSRQLYADIAAGLITKMSWAFVIEEDSYDDKTETRTISKVKKVYDVSAVSIPANDDTDIAARTFAEGRHEAKQKELLERSKQLLLLKSKL